MRRVLGKRLLVAACAVVMLAGCGVQGHYQSEHDAGVTLAEFNTLHPGMAYASTIKIIGDPGEKIGDFQSAGVRTVTYWWVNKDGTKVSAVFQNDKLITKTQFGLKSP